MDANLMAFLEALVGSAAGCLFAWLVVTVAFRIRHWREYRRLKRQYLAAYDAAAAYRSGQYLVLEPGITPRDERDDA